MRRPMIAGLALAALLAAPLPSLAQSRPLNVEVDHSARIQLRGAAASVIVGNSAIADVTVVDANTLFVTGKGYGVTEVIAVDAIGRTLFQGEVVVTASTSGHVRVWRGGQATDMACAASCAPSIRSGPAATAAPAAP